MRALMTAPCSFMQKSSRPTVILYTAPVCSRSGERVHLPCNGLVQAPAVVAHGVEVEMAAPFDVAEVGPGPSPFMVASSRCAEPSQPLEPHECQNRRWQSPECRQQVPMNREDLLLFRLVLPGRGVSSENCPLLLLDKNSFSFRASADKIFLMRINFNCVPKLWDCDYQLILIPNKICRTVLPEEDVVANPPHSGRGLQPASSTNASTEG
jgi:hypothetical protein